MKLFKNFYTEYKRNKLVEQINNLFTSSLNEQEIVFDKTLIKIFDEIENQNQIAEFLFKQLKNNFKLNIDGELKNVEEVFAHPSKPDFLEIHFTKPNGSKAKSEMKVGKFITALVKEMNHKDLKPKPEQIEHFVKLVYSERTGDTNELYEFKIVSGKDIKKYYNQKQSECLGGGLGSSCMRYDNTQEYVEFYTELDPKQCSLLIRVNKYSDKIVGRALIWTLDSGDKYLDRIYVADNKNATLFEDYRKKNGIKYSFDFNKNKTPETVTIKDWKMRRTMPYMDTFTRGVISENNLILIAFQSSKEEDEIKSYIFKNYDSYKLIFTLRGTDGTFKIFKNPLLITYSQEFLENVELLGSLTVEKLREKHSWIFECKIKDVKINLDNFGNLVWKSGTFLGGTWEDGIWEKGTWEKGTWENGIWENGIWYNGTWEDGFWKKGIWQDGIWKDGAWENGTWKKGTWEDPKHPHPNER